MPSFPMTPVTSSNVEAVGYDADRQELKVRYAGGRSYTYVGVEDEVAQGALNANSVGRYLIDNVKDRYPFR